MFKDVMSKRLQKIIWWHLLISTDCWCYLICSLGIFSQWNSQCKSAVYFYPPWLSKGGIDQVYSLVAIWINLTTSIQDSYNAQTISNTCLSSSWHSRKTDMTLYQKHAKLKTNPKQCLSKRICENVHYKMGRVFKLWTSLQTEGVAQT